tara:strand:- start:10640 stop:11368 length:729 start_codon:yes stop_codon:yes gene_type:complete
MDGGGLLFRFVFMLCCEGENMSEWVRKGAVLSLVVLVGLMSLGQATAHEQETYNVIVVADGPMPANITDSDFVQGNAVVFRMKDTTENASIRISIDVDQDGVYENTTNATSVWLVASCELAENGTLVDENCAVSHGYEFAFDAPPGTYTYRLERAINNSVVTDKEYSITLWKDVHEEPGVPNMGECFGIGCDEEVIEAASDETTREEALLVVAAVAAIGTFGLALSIFREPKQSDVLSLEEE